MRGKKITLSGIYYIEPHGEVQVHVRSNATRIVARWKNGMLNATVPKGIDYDALQKFISASQTKIQQIKPVAPYADEMELEFLDFRITITRQSHLPSKIFMNFKSGNGCIEVGTDWDIEAPDTITKITKLICRMAQSYAPGVLLPFAKSVAEEIGMYPMAWEISNGHRVLGHCNSKGEIALSYALLFYPLHLRRYVVCHELAHLTEMNHSPRFHSICDEYCDGKESELISELKNYKVNIPL